MSWYITRKMHDGYFQTYADGYQSWEKARDAIKRAASKTHVQVWRAETEYDSGKPYIMEGTKVSGRWQWKVIDPDAK